jgi:hypothetical protein
VEVGPPTGWEVDVPLVLAVAGRHADQKIATDELLVAHGSYRAVVLVVVHQRWHEGFPCRVRAVRQAVVVRNQRIPLAKVRPIAADVPDPIRRGVIGRRRFHELVVGMGPDRHVEPRAGREPLREELVFVAAIASALVVVRQPLAPEPPEIRAVIVDARERHEHLGIEVRG